MNLDEVRQAIAAVESVHSAHGLVVSCHDAYVLAAACSEMMVENERLRNQNADNIVSAAMHSAGVRLTALEEAAKAMCERCGWGNYVFRDGDEYSHGTDEVPGSSAPHAAVYAYPEPCHADPIRRLIAAAGKEEG